MGLPFLNDQMVQALFFGCCVGFLVQRSQFCTVSAFRDAYLFKQFKNTKAFIAIVATMTLLFTFWMTFAPERVHPTHTPIGWYMLVGGIIFGIGMTLCGACTITTWTRSGEGYISHWLIILFTFFGICFYSIFWNYCPWPPEMRLWTIPNPSHLHWGIVDATTIQAQYGIPPILLGLCFVFFYYKLFRKLEEIERRK
jgi:hypothetical protein